MGKKRVMEWVATRCARFYEAVGTRLWLALGWLNGRRRRWHARFRAVFGSLLSGAGPPWESVFRFSIWWLAGTDGDGFETGARRSFGCGSDGPAAPRLESAYWSGPTLGRSGTAIVSGRPDLYDLAWAAGVRKLATTC